MKICSLFLCAILLGEGTICSAEPSLSDRKLADQNMSQYFRLIKGGEEDGALKCVSKAISLAPAPIYYRERADLYMSLNKNKEAMDDAKNAVKIRKIPKILEF